MQLKSYPFFLLFFFSFYAVTQAQLSKAENRIASAVMNRTVASVALLKEVVNSNSGTLNFAGVKNVGSIFQKELKLLGFETRWVSGDAFNRAGHLVAIHKGKKGKKILLIGHLDTVFEPDSPFQTLEMQNDSIAHGPGVADMKGGDVIMLCALQALYDAGYLKEMNIQVVLTGDEEMSGKPLDVSKKELIEAAKWADIALGYEDGDGAATRAVVARRGSSEWTLTVRGNAAHSSQIFTETVGVGAIYEASRIINAFYVALSAEKDLTFSPGIIAGGNKLDYDSSASRVSAYGKGNIVAQEVMVKGDLRAVSTSQLELARNKMRTIVAQNYPGTTAHIDFGDGGYPPMTLTEGNKKLLVEYSKVSSDLGYAVQTMVNPRDAGAADICFANDWVDMALDGIGMPGADGHTVNETANLNYLPIEAKRSAVLIYRLAFNTISPR